MNLIILSVVLIMHVSGVWSLLPNGIRSNIVRSSQVVSLSPISKPAPVIFAPLPHKTGDETIKIEAPGVYAIDSATSLPLFEQNAAKPRPIASITKLVTAIVVMSRHTPNEKVTIGKLPSYDPSAEIMGLKEGDIYTLEDLIKASLIPSYNDAADALAIYDSGSVTKFAARMNIKMSQWGITGTRFVSASGLTDDGNFATPLALTKIAKLALTNPVISKTVNMQSATISSSTGKKTTMTTTNQLLATGQYYGIKTGYTQAAGECFVGLTRVAGHDVITVILGSSDRFGETQTLVNWIGRNYQWL